MHTIVHVLFKLAPIPYVKFSLGPRFGLWLTKHTNTLGTPNLQALYISENYNNEIDKVYGDIEPKA